MHTCKFRIALLLLLPLIAALVGCGGGGGSNVAPLPINNSPSLTLMDPTSTTVTLDVTQHQTLPIKVKVNDPDGGELNLEAITQGGSFNPALVKVQAGAETTVTFTPPAYNGQCNVTLTVHDGAASATKTLTVNVVGYGTPTTPTLRITSISMSPKPVAPGGTATFTASVDNPEGKTLTYRWSCRAGQITGNNNTGTWTTPNDPGVYGVYVTVSDGTYSVKSGTAATVSEAEGGLLGQYFETTREHNIVQLSSEIFRRIDPNVNFNWYLLSPDPSKMPTDGWGAKWTGFVKCEEAGNYVFRVHVDDGVRMKIMNDANEWVEVIPNNSQNWIDHTEGAWLPDPTVPIHLDGGKWYPIELDFFEGAEEAYIVLYWSVNGSSEVIVPQSVLKPPS